MPMYRVTVEQYERHVATYEEDVEANTSEDAVAAAVRRVIDGDTGEPAMSYCDTPEDSGAIEIPGVSEHRMYAALTLAGVSVEDEGGAYGPCVATIRSAYVEEIS